MIMIMYINNAPTRFILTNQSQPVTQWTQNSWQRRRPRTQLLLLSGNHTHRGAMRYYKYTSGNDTHTHPHTRTLCLNLSDNSITRNKTLEMLCWEGLSPTRIVSHKSQARNEHRRRRQRFPANKLFWVDLIFSLMQQTTRMWPPLKTHVINY